MPIWLTDVGNHGANVINIVKLLTFPLRTEAIGTVMAIGFLVKQEGLILSDFVHEYFCLIFSSNLDTRLQSFAQHDTERKYLDLAQMV